MVAHPSDGESVVDVASHAAEERERSEVNRCAGRDRKHSSNTSSRPLLDIRRCTVGTGAVEVAVHQPGDEVRRHADDQPVCYDG